MVPSLAHLFITGGFIAIFLRLHQQSGGASRHGDVSIGNLGRTRQNQQQITRSLPVRG